MSLTSLPRAAAGAADADVERLVEACQRGDSEAFGRLFTLYKDRVYSLAFYVTGSEEAAADASQEVFLKLLTCIGNFRGEARFETWLYRVAFNTIVDAVRRRRPSVPLDDVPPLCFASDGTPEADYEREHVARKVRDALDALTPEMRAAVVCRYVLDLDYAEIAARCDVAEGTVASRLSRARAELARRLRRLQNRFGA